MSEQPVGEWPDVPARSGVEVVLGAADRVTGAVAACSEAPMTADPRTVIRDKVATAIERARGRSHPGLRYSQHLADAAISAHLEALEQAARIDTVEELDACPVATVVLDNAQRLFECRRDTGYWYTPSDYCQFVSDELHLPCRVLYRPEES